MREAIAEEAAAAVTPGGSRVGSRPGGSHPAVKHWDANNLPILQNRFAKGLMARSRTARALLSRSSAFRVFMVGSSISMFGSRISTVAFPMLVLHLDNSPFIAGIVACAAIAPSILVYIPAGALVSRWNPWRVMLVSEWLRGLAIMSVVAVLAIFGRHTSIWFLMLAMVAEEILEIFFTLADRRYLSRMMGRDNVASRQAYVEVRSHAAVLAGRPLGPLLFVIQPFLPFLADGVSFLFSIGSLLLVRRPGNPAREARRAPSGQLRKEVRRGFTLLNKDRRAFATVLLMAAGSTVAQALILIFLCAAHSREMPTTTIGFVLAASGPAVRPGRSSAGLCRSASRNAGCRSR